MPKSNKMIKRKHRRSRKNKRLSINGGLKEICSFKPIESLRGVALESLKNYNERLILNDCDDKPDYPPNYLEDLQAIIRDTENESNINQTDDPNPEYVPDSYIENEPSTRSNSMVSSISDTSSDTSQSKSSIFSNLSMPKMTNMNLGISTYLNKNRELKKQKNEEEQIKNMTELQSCQYQLDHSLENEKEWKKMYFDYVNQTRPIGGYNKSKKHYTSRNGKGKRNRKLSKRKFNK